MLHGELSIMGDFLPHVRDWTHVGCCSGEHDSDLKTLGIMSNTELQNLLL